MNPNPTPLDGDASHPPHRQDAPPSYRDSSSRPNKLTTSSSQIDLTSALGVKSAKNMNSSRHSQNRCNWRNETPNPLVDEAGSPNSLNEASLDRCLPKIDRGQTCDHVALPDSRLCLQCLHPERLFGVMGVELNDYIASLTTWERKLQSAEIVRNMQLQSDLDDYVAQCARAPPLEPAPLPNA